MISRASSLHPFFSSLQPRCGGTANLRISSRGMPFTYCTSKSGETIPRITPIPLYNVYLYRFLLYPPPAAAAVALLAACPGGASLSLMASSREATCGDSKVGSLWTRAFDRWQYLANRPLWDERRRAERVGLVDSASGSRYGVGGAKKGWWENVWERISARGVDGRRARNRAAEMMMNMMMMMICIDRP